MSYYTLVTKIQVPPYTRKQEFFNSISHFLGLPLALFIYFFGLGHYLTSEINYFAYIGLTIFSSTVAMVYGFSAIYHNLPADTLKKKIFRIIDHGDIFTNCWHLYSNLLLYD